MAYILITVIRGRTIIDYAVYSRELAPVEFDQNAIGLALREDPCFHCSQYFVIRYFIHPDSLLELPLPQNNSTRRSCCKRLNNYTCETKQKELSLPTISFIHVGVSYRTEIHFQSVLAYHSFKELVRSHSFRAGFVRYIHGLKNWMDVRNKVCRCQQLYDNCDFSISVPRLIEIGLLPTVEQVCLSWCYRVEGLVRKRYFLEDTMNWLSTLGGGYSSLGDYFQHFSERAGLISITQFKIALEMGDPVMAAKCRLFYALSQLQQGNLQRSKKILRREYHLAHHGLCKDQKLIDMCLGMWSKLQYFYHRRKLSRLSLPSV